MSDREIVTFDAAQFAKLETAINGITAKLEDKLAHIERTLKGGFTVLAQGGSGDNSQVLNAINNLNRKVDEFMATQEERLQAILVAVKNVKQMLADLKANNPAIDDEITAIEAELAPAEPPAQG
jgi:SMC interacting uncharacterized protein involved in chromosome segregation